MCLQLPILTCEGEIDQYRMRDLCLCNAVGVGLMLLITEFSAYLDTEQDISLLEKLAKLEDVLKKQMTGEKES